jgi:uncharacterized protein
MPHSDQKPTQTIRIQRYSPGQITLGNQTYHHAILLYQNQIHIPTPQNLAALSHAIIDHWLDRFNPDLLLIGTGDTHIYLDPGLFDRCQTQQVGVEVLSTDQCLRTIVALQGDVRQSLAFLLP